MFVGFVAIYTHVECWLCWWWVGDQMIVQNQIVCVTIPSLVQNKAHEEENPINYFVRSNTGDYIMHNYAPLFVYHIHNECMCSLDNWITQSNYERKKAIL